MARVILTSNSTKVSKHYRHIARKMPEVLDEHVKTLAQDAAALFEKTTQTWTHQPQFFLVKTQQAHWTVATPDPVYHFLDKGTRVRYATMSKDWKSKTKPGVVASYQGKGHMLFVNRKMPRPGIQARRWSEIIIDRAQRTAPNHLRRVLSEAAAGSGAGL